VNRGIPAAAVAAVLAFSPHLGGQAQPSGERGRSYSIHASGRALAPELTRVETMLRNGTLDIRSSEADTMIGGRRHERLQQMYRGVPVFGAQVVRQIDGRSALSLSGRLYDNITIDATPRVSAAEAGDIARAASGSGANLRRDPLLGVLAAAGQSYKLAYQVQVQSDRDVREVAVDALNGAVIYSRSLLLDVNVVGEGIGVLGDKKKMSVNSTSSTFQAIDGLRPAIEKTYDFRGSVSRLTVFLATGLLTTADLATDSDNVWTDGPTVDAHAYQGFVYDYYFKRHGRRGLDNHDLEVDGIVHPLQRSLAPNLPPDLVDTFINNAFFCCDGVMFYGDGDGTTFTYFAAGLDVVAHEMTHGVTQFSSDLVYQDESGALNEAFSDIMAASVEFFIQPQGTGPDKSDWLIGEDVTLAPPGYLRSLKDPNSVGDPDHYSLRKFIGTDTDNGGVHTNLTIATHAFYLAVAGGKNRVSGITVTGVGMNNIDKMEKIFYRAFVLLMTPNSQFSDARAATLQAASDLYGAASNERAQVQAAWTAVGVN
jgi:bacillolysin